MEVRLEYMMHLVFLINSLSLCTEAVSFAFSWFFFAQYKKKAILFFSLLLFMIMLLTLSRMVELYGIIIHASGNPVITLSTLCIEKMAFTFGIASGPFFCFHLIGIPISKKTTVVLMAP